MIDIFNPIYDINIYSGGEVKDIVRTFVSDLHPDFISFGNYSFSLKHLCDFITEFAEDPTMKDYYLYSFPLKERDTASRWEDMNRMMRISWIANKKDYMAKVQKDMDNFPKINYSNLTLVEMLMYPYTIIIGEYVIGKTEFNYFIDELALSINDKDIKSAKKATIYSKNSFFHL
ncbi:MAG: hypothetical protein ABH828_06385 [archaeon]